MPNTPHKYQDFLEKIEQMSQLLYIVVAKLVALITFVPALIVTLVNYFVYNLGDDSYFLPMPLMYYGFVGFLMHSIL